MPSVNQIFIVDKPGKFPNFTLHQRLHIISSAHNVQHANNHIVELFEEIALMTRRCITTGRALSPFQTGRFLETLLG